MIRKIKKIILATILISFISITFLVSAPRPARAQLVVETPSLTAWEVVKEVGKKILGGIMQSGTIALMNAVNSFTQKIAYDTAVWVASGGGGQKPLFDGKSFGDYVSDTAMNSAMVFITDFSDATLGKYGFDVCAPNLSLVAKIKIGWLGMTGPKDVKTARCDWGNFSKNWEQFGSSLGNAEVLKNFGSMFEPGQSELGFALEFNNKVVAETDNSISTAIAERTRSGGWKDVKDFVTGKVMTPSEVVQSIFKQNTQDLPGDQLNNTMSATTNALMGGAYQILPSMLSTFTNTLLNKTMERAMQGLFPQSLFSDETANNVANSSGSASPSGLAIGRRVAQEVFSDLIKPKILTSGNYDPLMEFTTCPGRSDEKQINNCVLDDNFATAIRSASQGKPLTVSEAIEQGYLDGSKLFISSQDARNEQSDCYQNGYCYSNLVKLRKARILPVGWELAAELTAGGSSVDLNTVMNGFNDCAASGVRDDSHKWCHMVDPNWILRLPATQCNAKVYGPTLASSGGNLRAETCADPITCISEDESGNCVGGWGYCVKERNIWRIAADQCPEQFNTCLTYKARDNKVTNYLKNTVDYGVCNSSNTGCRSYSKNKKNDVWASDLGDSVYLNKDAEKCEAKSAGCSELYSKSGGLAYNLLSNSSFEKNDGSLADGWVNPHIFSTQADAYDGAVSLQMNDLSPGIETEKSIRLEPNTAYAFSIFAKGVSGAANSATVTISIFTDDVQFTPTPFSVSDLISSCNSVSGFTLSETQNVPSDSFKRLSCAFLTPDKVLYGKVSFSVGEDSAVWFDAAQLEEGSAATAYLSQGYGGQVNSVFVKVAPPYLDCPAGSQDQRCSAYAPACKAEEVGCEKYSPADGASPPVSGVVTINDTCPEVCNGYETYRQERTAFESEKFPVYLIPESAKTCQAADAGCDEFTNLATEAKEYFNFIRQCIKETGAPKQWDVFYTWEGSDTAGYQLRAHKLKTGAPQTGETGPVPAVADSNYSACTAAIFKLPLGSPDYNPDCREFYNANGSISYRLLSKTIIATDDCAGYRKTESTVADCGASGGTWNPDGQYCAYQGYKAESRSCSAAANKCRVYSGAGASNLRFVFQDDFEAGDGGWKGGTVSSEALSAGGHSLKSASSVLSAASVSKPLAGLISPNGTYFITFWAKGTGTENMTVAISGAEHGAGKASGFTVALKGDWQYYELGPINTLASLGANPSLTMALASGKGFYADNIILKEAEQKLYLIKDSGNVPAVCNQTANGLPLPQAMLGCKAYINRNSETIYLKSFSSLCRDEAVGCGAYQQTFNSASDKNEIHNVICARSDKTGGACKYKGQDVCVVAKNNSICRFTITDNVAPASFFRQSDYKDYAAFQEKVRSAVPVGYYLAARDESTVEIPADKTIYIVNDKKYQCAAADKGCSALGQTELYTGKNAVDVYLKNKPDDYGKIMCAAEAGGCESWVSSKGTDYFKSPKRTCEFKEAAGGNPAGWYAAGANEACYPGLMQAGGYGIWRNADQNYGGAVGLCPAAQNTCTEFIDPLGTASENASGKPYYLLDNDKLNNLAKDQSCNGGASLTEGCVLFNKTSDLELKWKADATYAKADKEKKTVAPISQYGYCGLATKIGSATSVDYEKICFADSDCPANGTASKYTIVFPMFYTGQCAIQTEGDSNVVLKVTRDRECGEWLSCKTSYKATDPVSNTTKLVCAELGLCDKYQAGSPLCANFIDNNPDSGKLLLADYYSARKIGWESEEYSGYSIGGQYPVTDIKFKNIGQNGISDARMFGKILYGWPADKFYDLKGNESPSSAIGEKTICRGYPEQDSPFPASAAQFDLNGRRQAEKSGFQNANICENGKDCECDYTKLVYGSNVTSKFTTYGDRSAASGICQGGSKSGLPCAPSATYDTDPANACGKPEEGGACLRLQRQNDVIGWKGYCLERDLATPVNGNTSEKACATWLPQDVAPGAKDIYNQFRTAGYVPPIGGGKYYCIEASGNYSFVSKDPRTNYSNPLVTYTKAETIKIVGNGFGTGDGYTGTLPARDLDKNITLSWLKTQGRIRYYANPQAAINTEPSAITGEKNIIGRPVYKNEIDLIEIKFVKGHGIDSPASNSVFYIRADQPLTNYLGYGELCDGIKKTTSCIGEDAGSSGLSGTQKAKSIISGDDWFFRFDNGQGTKNIKDYTSIDLFKATGDLAAFCQADTGGVASQDTMALRFRFDPISGVLKELGVASCSSDSDVFNDFDIGISIRKREKCTAVVDMAAFENQAFTNTLWQYNPDNIAKKYPSTLDDKILPYHYDYEAQPFGSASADISPDGKSAWYSYYTVGSPTFAGVPWACKENCGTPQPSDKQSGTVDFNPTSVFTKLHDAYAGGLSDAREYLGKLFSKIYNIFRFKPGTQIYEAKSCSDSDLSDYCDLTELESMRIDLAKYPQVYSFDMGKKLINGQYALLSANKFLINGQSQNINIRGNQHTAAMQFYFWADTDHMPVKSIKVNWGDGSVFETVGGMYKNHKPLCAKSNTEGAAVCSKNDNMVCNAESGCPVNAKAVPPTCSGEFCGRGTATVYTAANEPQTCASPKITFGNSPDACEEGYFEIRHTYTCSSQSCPFKPTLVITDNWGITNEFIRPNGETPANGLFGPATGPTITLTP